MKRAILTILTCLMLVARLGGQELETIEGIDGQVVAEISEIAPMADEYTKGLGLRQSFWIVSDEPDAANSLSILAQRRNGSWTVLHIPGEAPPNARGTTDSEALLFHRQGVLVVGSHFGDRHGPLQESRHFSALTAWPHGFGAIDNSQVFLHPQWPGDGLPGGGIAWFNLARRRVVPHAFDWHRAINNALARSSLALIERGENERVKFIESLPHTIRNSADRALNIEAALNWRDEKGQSRWLLGLRFPVMKQGQPIVVCIEPTQDGMSIGQVLWCAAVQGVGAAAAPVGFRAFAVFENEIHAVVGQPETRGALIEDSPQADRASSSHIRLRIDESAAVPTIRGELVRALPDVNTEGLVRGVDGAWYYTLDKPMGDDGKPPVGWLKKAPPDAT